MRFLRAWKEITYVLLSTQCLAHTRRSTHLSCRICYYYLCSLTSFHHIMLEVGVIWPPRRISFALFCHPSHLRDMIEGKYMENNNSARESLMWGWLLKPDIHSASLRVSGGAWHSPTDVQPALIDHTNDDGFPPLRHLITSCPGIYHHFPGQSRPPPTPAHEGPFLLTPRHPEHGQLKNSFISPPSTPLITNSAKSWITQNKRQICLPRDINKIIKNKHSEALSSWENFNLLTPALQKPQVFSHNYKTPRVLLAWVICWHTFTTLAPCSHWPIISFSTGTLNQAFSKQCRKPERNSPFLVKFSYSRLPRMTEVHKERERRRWNYIG